MYLDESILGKKTRKRRYVVWFIFTFTILEEPEALDEVPHVDVDSTFSTSMVELTITQDWPHDLNESDKNEIDNYIGEFRVIFDYTSNP